MKKIKYRFSTKSNEQFHFIKLRLEIELTRKLDSKKIAESNLLKIIESKKAELGL